MARVSKQKLIDRSNKNMASGTHSVVRESALELISRAYDEGINVQISEGHRPNSRQNALYAQGRTKPGNIVTNAKAGQSWHNYGIAVDFFLTNNSGSKAIWTVNSKWRRAAQIGKNLGFEWGGDWSSFKDYPHLQMTGGLTMSQMRAGRKPHLVSKVNNPVKPSNKPSKPSKPAVTKWVKVTGNWTGQSLRKGQHGTPVLQMQQMLASVYFFPDKGAKLDGVDGYFGPDTKDAVQRYQGMKGLKVDGIPGKDVYKSLKGNTKPPKPSKPAPKPNTSGTWTTQVLKSGSKGKAVRELQQLLVSNNFYPNIKAKNNGVDGSFGPATKDAVQRFQMMNGLSVDGIAGPGTKKKLGGGSSKPSKTKPSSKWNGSPVLQVGSKGRNVTDLQNMLSAKHFYPNKKAKNNGVDGSFGPDTKDAVQRFQMMNGLSVDGIAGPATRSKLKGSKAPSKPRPSSKWNGSPVLRVGSKGRNVTDLQNMLSAKHFYPNKKAKNNGVDGYFGPDTKDAVQRFQIMSGLKVDGIAGKGTYNKLRK